MPRLGFRLHGFHITGEASNGQQPQLLPFKSLCSIFIIIFTYLQMGIADLI